MGYPRSFRIILTTCILVLLVGCQNTRLRPAAPAVNQNNSSVPGSRLAPAFTLKRLNRAPSDAEMAGELVYLELSATGSEARFRAEGREFKTGEKVLIRRSYPPMKIIKSASRSLMTRIRSRVS